MLKENNTSPPKEIPSRSDLEKYSIKEILRRSKHSENIPPMTEPLVQILSYNGMKEWGDNMLRGK